MKATKEQLELERLACRKALEKACKKLNESGKCPPHKNAFCPTCSANNTLRFYCWMEWAENEEVK